jgi:hypothetical protein
MAEVDPQEVSRISAVNRMNVVKREDSLERLGSAFMLTPAGKKIGAENGDPNLRFQPRLPGSVVGEASMGQGGNSGKITRVTGLK